MIHLIKVQKGNVGKCFIKTLLKNKTGQTFCEPITEL